MIKKAILEYIPQRPPFVMVDKLISCDEQQTRTELNILPDNLFVENSRFTEMGILENIAQTCAARLGYLNSDQPVKIGMIGSVNNFEVYSLPEVGKKINTVINVDNEVFNVVIITANVLCDEQPVASCNMKVILTDVVSSWNE
ncbi:MAG: hydroxymyristoyl-ACP dehydratase [Bacteroidales bacterium]|jgi:3-hydroxymyristoyl/3-hydroxydecanoyl-(acyl carrier protein) dehydratase|nr:hydroxymyristoyl-ACP dehydratase [Bacteroidales bacterium]